MAVMEINANICAGFSKPGVSCFFTSILKAGKASDTINTPIIAAISANRSDSPINCATSVLLPAPSTFLTPTSLARFSLRAVERFMKLMQAINKMIQAMIENILTYSTWPPPVCLPFSNWSYKCQSFMLNKKGRAIEVGSRCCMKLYSCLFTCAGFTPGFNSTYVFKQLLSHLCAHALRLYQISKGASHSNLKVEFGGRSARAADTT